MTTTARVSVERDSGRLVFSARYQGAALTVELAPRAAQALASVLHAACDALDPDFSADFRLDLSSVTTSPARHDASHPAPR